MAARIRVRVKLEAHSEEEVQHILAHHIHRMVKYREAISTEVIPMGVRQVELHVEKATNPPC